MAVVDSKRARIFWHELAKKWAIRVPVLQEPTRMKLFTAALRQTCGGVFNEKAQVWLVPEAHLERVRGLVAKYYKYCEFIDRQAPPPPPPPEPADNSYRTFCHLVGWTRVTHPSRAQAKVLYRQAAARLHPDVGGSADEMASLNAAWRAIRDTLPP